MTGLKQTRVAVIALWFAAVAPALAEDSKSPAPPAPPPVTTAAPTGAKPSDSPPEAELTAEEKAEKEGRRACKAAICGAFRTGKSEGPDLACTVIKSWRKEQLEKLVSKLKLSWPYGPVRCTADVRLKRADLAKALTTPKADADLDTQNVTCVVTQEKDPPSEIKFQFKPKVSFENGKATAAQLNWGKLEAPTLMKTALWTATAADNAVNLLSSTLVVDINDFVGKKCDEVKSDWDHGGASQAITKP